MPPKRDMVFDNYDGSDSNDGSKGGKCRKLEKGTDEYVKRRERNNIAVKKSREKSRQKAKETMQQVNALRAENEQLEQKVQILSKELSVLKDLFLAHAGTVTTGDRGNGDVISLSPSDHQYSVNIKDESA